MDALGTYIILLFNGTLNLAGRIGDPITLMGLAAAAALWWLAVVEVEELNRQGAKPVVGRH